MKLVAYSSASWYLEDSVALSFVPSQVLGFLCTFLSGLRLRLIGKNCPLAKCFLFCTDKYCYKAASIKFWGGLWYVVVIVGFVSSAMILGQIQWYCDLDWVKEVTF